MLFYYSCILSPSHNFFLVWQIYSNHKEGRGGDDMMWTLRWFSTPSSSASSTFFLISHVISRYRPPGSLHTPLSSQLMESLYRFLGTYCVIHSQLVMILYPNYLSHVWFLFSSNSLFYQIYFGYCISHLWPLFGGEGKWVNHQLHTADIVTA